MSVFAGVRRAADGAALEAQGGGRITPLVLDIRQDESIANAAETVGAAVGGHGLFALVNNAAAGGRGSPLEYVTREVLEDAFQVTACGTFLLIRALAPAIRLARGRIVNVGAGRLPLPLLGAGFGAKFAMEAMSDVLRVELRQTGVRVAIVEPGMTRWEDVDAQLADYDRAFEGALQDVPAEDRERFENAVAHFKRVNRRMMRTAAPADRVAATIERAITARRPRARYHCGWEQKVVSWMERLTTERTRDAVVGRMMGL
jgi:NAD(P)-dependent dehydrogenase (short-subunit alcohol dehydrogenase family)